MILKLWKSKVWKCPTRSLFVRYRVQLVKSCDRIRHIRSDSAVFGNVEAPLFVKPLFSYSNVIKRYGSSEGTLDKLAFESICSDTLESLTEYFEELVENTPQFKNGDVTYSDGVLTVQLGKSYGTYVINRQTPNLQIWLSSPTSGPKRYDFVNGTWIYKHDKTTLHSLLDKELKILAEKDVEFTERCSYSRSKDS